jgi:Short C-terminal domain
LASVDGVQALTWSYIQLAAAGSSAKFSTRGRENVDRLVAIIRDRIAAASPAAQGAPDVDVAQEIRAVASLRDDGLITEDEYQQKKAQLLGL